MTVLAINSDTKIRQNVQQELHWDSRVDDSEVGVAVHEGVVTLTGTVDSYAAKQAAAEAAANPALTTEQTSVDAGWTEGTKKE